MQREAASFFTPRFFMEAGFAQRGQAHFMATQFDCDPATWDRLSRTDSKWTRVGRFVMTKQNADTISGGVFLVGLGVLFLIHWFWPGILLLLGLVALVREWMQGERSKGLTAFLILGGLAVFFSFNFSWSIVLPVALICLGLIGIVNALRSR
jgi:hypothetical protein